MTDRAQDDWESEDRINECEKKSTPRHAHVTSAHIGKEIQSHSAASARARTRIDARAHKHSYTRDVTHGTCSSVILRLVGDIFEREARASDAKLVSAAQAQA